MNHLTSIFAGLEGIEHNLILVIEVLVVLALLPYAAAGLIWAFSWTVIAIKSIGEAGRIERQAAKVKWEADWATWEKTRGERLGLARRLGRRYSAWRRSR
jgi:hypothetical protein